MFMMIPFICIQSTVPVVAFVSHSRNGVMTMDVSPVTTAALWGVDVAGSGMYHLCGPSVIYGEIVRTLQSVETCTTWNTHIFDVGLYCKKAELMDLICMCMGGGLGEIRGKWALGVLCVHGILCEFHYFYRYSVLFMQHITYTLPPNWNCLAGSVLHIH